MMKTTLLLLTIVLSLQSSAQSLYMPRNVKAAYEKGTRAMDGNPGPHYWQNRSNYTIDLTMVSGWTRTGRIMCGKEEINNQC